LINTTGITQLKVKRWFVASGKCCWLCENHVASLSRKLRNLPVVFRFCTLVFIKGLCSNPQD